MSVLNPILKPVLGPTIALVLFTERTRPTGGTFTYLRSDGTSSIFRPDGTSIYTRP
jgi:hypothetical protein